MAPRCCAIVPTFQAIETLPEVLRHLDGAVECIIVVDDGSTDGTRDALDAWCAGTAHESRGGAARLAILRSHNGGKAAALRDGFAKASELGFDRALTIDADGQHDPADARRMLARAATGLICGVRDPRTPGYPRRNLTGRRLNDLAIRAQTGVRVEDSPCGLRVYPLSIVAQVRCISGRFAWEEEFITRAIWAGARYEPHPIRCIYHEGPLRRSHYRFLRDWPEGIAVNLWLTALAALPPLPNARAIARFARQIEGALAPARAMDQLAGDSPSRLHGGAAMAFGALGSIGAADLISGGGLLLQASEMRAGGESAAWSAWHGAWPALLAAWLMIRLHGSIWLALAGGAVALALIRVDVPTVVAAALLLAVTWTLALRRRDP